MTMTYKTLGQLYPASTAQADLYTCPSATNALLSRLVVSNHSGSTALTFSATIAPLGAADTPAHYFAFNITISPNETISIELGAGLVATDKVRVTASAASSISFHVYGVEIT